MKDYYSILGVAHGADGDEIKRAWRKLAHKFHPDKTGGDDNKFKEVNEAYYVLSDQGRRAQYDRFGTAASGFSAGGGSGANGAPFGGAGMPFGEFSGEFASGFEDWFSEILENFFAGSGLRSSGRSERFEKGKDIHVEITVPFETIFTGLTQELSLKMPRPCERCHGSAREPGTAAVSCKACGGVGRLHRVEQTIFGTVTRLVTCPTCFGRGDVPESPCTTCNGEGRQERIERIEAHIPPGVEDGETLRFRKYGAAGRAGATAGDLYVTVRVLAHKRLRREGIDLWIDEEISFPAAVLGGTIAIELPGGTVNLKIPGGTPSGKVFRLSKHGVPNRKDSSVRRGDVFVRVNVRVPHKASEHVKRLLREIEGELT